MSAPLCGFSTLSRLLSRISLRSLFFSNPCLASRCATCDALIDPLSSRGANITAAELATSHRRVTGIALFLSSFLDLQETVFRFRVRRLK